MTQRTKLPLIGAGQQQKNLSLNPQLIRNMYEIASSQSFYAKDNSEDKVPLSLSTMPGTSLLVQTPNKGEIRGQCVINQTNYVVSGSILYALGISGTFLNLGTLSTSTGLVSMVTNGLQLMIVDGYFGYTFTFSTGVFAKITDPNFPVPAPSTITYQAGRAIVYQPNSTKWWVSNINDFTTYNSLAFAAANNDAQNSAQNITSIVATPNYLYIFKTWSTEVWYLISDPIFPYNLYQQVIMDQGCSAPWTICRADSTIIWLSSNEQGQSLLVSSNLFRPTKVLDEAAQYQFSTITNPANCYATVMQIEGHTFYILTSPSDNKTWALDISTHRCVQLSSTYVSGVDGQGNPNYSQGQHLFRTHQFFNGQNVIGDYRGGNLLVWDPNTYTDYNCGPNNAIKREVISSIIAKDRQRVFIPSLEIDCECGDMPNPSGLTPNVRISVSRDGGHTFDNPRLVSFGGTGQYKFRPKLNGFGYFYDGAIKVETDAITQFGINSLIADVIVAEQ